jgi:hypothetical protein
MRPEDTEMAGGPCAWRVDARTPTEYAFPVNSPELQATYLGMTLRDYFAAAALTGLIARRLRLRQRHARRTEQS